MNQIIGKTENSEMKKPSSSRSSSNESNHHGAGEMDMHKGEIGGEKMLWSSYSAQKNLEIVEKAGFKVLESYQEDWRGETHLWILAESQ